MVDMNTWFGIQQLYADYAAAVDSGQWDLWPDFFTEQCIYRVQPRENHERGFPTVNVERGRISAQSVLAAPFGSTVPIDPTEFTPLADWQPVGL